MAYWKAGDKLNNGKFVVEELLGSGGFGVTYKIRQTRTNKLYALKTLNELARSKPDFQQLQSKFINEAIALASCSHPNIVKVYPQGFQEGELWCMVMEYVEGKDLSRHLDERDKFEEKKAVEIITKVGEALSYVHQQGLLHRDIKPANILLRKSNSTPVLIDFGLAREYNANPDSIRSMTSSMTECFAPIEQYQRQGRFGAWTDVYALAATLYVLVTKQMPFPARFREHADLVPPKKYNPQLSDRINKAIVKGLELQPEDRLQTVKAWLEMLNPPQPKPKPQPPVKPEYNDPPTIPVPPRNNLSKQNVLISDEIPIQLINHPELKSKIKSNINSKNLEKISRLNKYEKEMKILLNRGLDRNSKYFKQQIYRQKTRLGLKYSDIYKINKKLNIKNDFETNMQVSKDDISKSVNLKNYEIKVRSLLNRGLNPNSYYFQEQVFHCRNKMGLKYSDIYKINKKLNIKDDFETTSKDKLIFFGVIGFFMIIVFLLLLFASQ